MESCGDSGVDVERRLVVHDERRVCAYLQASLRKRMKGFEPSTFAMARRRSSQLSYIRECATFYPAQPGRRARTW